MRGLFSFDFFFNDPAATEIYTLSLHDALPICAGDGPLRHAQVGRDCRRLTPDRAQGRAAGGRSEEHTSELQSHVNLVCRLLLEKKKKITTIYSMHYPSQPPLMHA